METDYYCREFTEIELEIREHNKYRAANPLFIENTRKARLEAKKQPQPRTKKYDAKAMKASYAQCVADGTCTMCRTVKATDGRLCANCNEKQKERGRQRAAEKSAQRRRAIIERMKVA